MSVNHEENLVQVFAGTVWQAEVIKGLLDANGVPSTIRDNTLGAITSPYAGFEGDVQVIVNSTDKERALKIMEENSQK